MNNEKNYRSSETIPTIDDWGDLNADLDVEYAFKIYNGKTIEDIIPYVAENPIERIGDLTFVPDKVFAYYIQSPMQYLLSDESAGDSDAASSFLRLIQYKLKIGTAGLAYIWPSLKQAIDTIAERQSFYDASIKIYGSFPQLRDEIKSLAQLYSSFN